MKPGKTYSIRLKFMYNLTEGLDGFYLSTYKDKDGQVRTLATTHFEPTSARKAFPCFDEPQLKAKFLITITHSRSLQSFSNMPKKEESDVRGKNDQVRSEFMESLEMSTYLVAFVVCDFDIIEKKTDSNVTIRVIAAHDKISQAKFALDQAVQITQNYERYFGIPFPLPKQDLIAIPDFEAGAMENWGLITYRETALLNEEGVSSSLDTQWVAVVIAHELAHQWFGNLVTMQWWNDLWLNEGFASWMEYKGVDEVEPDWKMMDQFWINEVEPALDLDSLQSSHPISVQVQEPSEISALFDYISYRKGASIIHMLEQFLGEEHLRKGLEIYLKKNKFKNTVTKDLWNACTEATNNTKDVMGMMNTWTLQMGYPLIIFSRIGNSSVWNITQSRFLLAGQLNGTNSSLPASPYNYKWNVPVSFKTNLGHSREILLGSKDNDTSKVVTLDEKIKWIKGNTDGVGFYRVNYPTQIWTMLINQLNTDLSVFSGADRAQLIDDAFSLCMAGLLPVSVPVSLSTYLVKETDLVPWKIALRHLKSWKALLSDGPGGSAVDAFISFLVENIYKKLGWFEAGTHEQRLLRTVVLSAAVDAGLKDAVDRSKQIFTDVMDNQSKISSELQGFVYCTGVREGGEEEWNWIFKKYISTNIPAEKSHFLKALACSKDIFTLQRFLDKTLDKSQIRHQDVKSVLTSTAMNPAGTLLAWRQYRKFWDRYNKMFGDGMTNMGNIGAGIISTFSSSFDLEQVEDFFEKHETGGGKRAIDQAVEKIKVNIRFVELSAESVVGEVNIIVNRRKNLA
ncbi:glutamyl aminopeptidase isoform X2 [Eurytemora carolleeae]|uniref:glutamyl aminopeptidase isoform X2 n=1 Tax=Eurytemora carolleeae TaxID=1294199 RepID=UPI000C77160C|nr:glutamyl aminopeptidase isoform X2 [Eurytemora carolleeae]|eukprot:XP_023337481.1 glutamyl aminopeptidase-like isoform X2 [Eurytemora affinis]